MCGRYFIEEEDTPEELEEIIALLSRRQGDTSVKRGEIFPGDLAPVIANNRHLTPTPFVMRWGYTLGGRRIINARSETAWQSPLFADGMAQRRCIIPASHYFEWRHQGGSRTRFIIRPAGERTLYMAGIYRFEGKSPVFSILTRAPAEGIAFIHNRMPVILPENMCDAWLSPHCDPARILAHAREDMSFRSA